MDPFITASLILFVLFIAWVEMYRLFEYLDWVDDAVLGVFSLPQEKPRDWAKRTPGVMTTHRSPWIDALCL